MLLLPLCHLLSFNRFTSCNSCIHLHKHLSLNKADTHENTLLFAPPNQEFVLKSTVWLYSTLAFCNIFCQAGGAEEGSSEALWGAAAEDGGAGDWQRREQTDCPGYLKTKLSGSTY